jgi:hypothetical protein
MLNSLIQRNFCWSCRVMKRFRLVKSCKRCCSKLVIETFPTEVWVAVTSCAKTEHASLMSISLQAPRLEVSSPKDNCYQSIKLVIVYHAEPFCPIEHRSNEPTPLSIRLQRRADFTGVVDLFLLLTLALFLQHLLDNLLLLNEESSDNAVSNTATAS